MPYAPCPMPYAQSYLIFLRKAIICHTSNFSDGVKTMIASCLIPLTVCLIAAVITTGTDRRTLDGIPAPIAAIIGVFSLIWFVAACALPIKLGLVLVVLVWGKAYVQNIMLRLG